MRYKKIPPSKRFTAIPFDGTESPVQQLPIVAVGCMYEVGELVAVPVNKIAKIKRELTTEYVRTATPQLYKELTKIHKGKIFWYECEIVPGGKD